MLTLEWVIGIALLAALVGGAIGYTVSRFGRRGRNLENLSEELATVREAHEEYQREVVQQFEDTAVKFKKATESYADLHNQLARSASVLCGEVAAGSLLEGSIVQKLGAEAASPDSVPEDDATMTADADHASAETTVDLESPTEDVESPTDDAEIVVNEPPNDASTSNETEQRPPKLNDVA